MTQGLAARKAAHALMTAVLVHRRLLDEARGTNKVLRELEPRDAGFALAIAATTLRRLGQIDGVLARLLEKPLPERATAAHTILRAGIVELLFLRVPAHAAVDSAVEIAARDAATRGFKNLINAVLRRAAREGDALIAAQDEATLNTPGWLFERWQECFGEDTARAIGLAHLGEAPLDFSVKKDPELWAKTLDAEILPTGSLRRASGGRIEDLPGYSEGAWWIQDAAAALPALLLGDVRDAPAVDLCAAPGGKTAQLASRGARVTAVEISEKRATRLRDNLRRLKLDAELVVADAREFRPETPSPFVLLDAPCTATGTIRRHPDLPHLRKPADIATASALQRELLAAAAGMTAANGVLVYAVCSLEPEEGEQVIEDFLSRHSSFRRLPVKAREIGGFDFAITKQGDVRTLPSHLADKGGMDGFFIARLSRG